MDKSLNVPDRPLPNRSLKLPDIREAVRLHLAGNYEAAATSYRQILQRDSRDVEALRNLGALLYQQRSYGEAVKSFRKAAQCMPDSPEAFRELARALTASNALQSAVLAYQKSLRLASDPQTHYELASVLDSLGRRDEAIKHYRRAIDLQPDLAQAHNDLGVLLAKHLESDEALKHFARATELDPGLADAHSNLGSLLVDQGNIQDAVKAFEKAILLDPKHGKYFYHLAKVKSIGRGDPQVALMLELARDADALPDDDRIALHFALGKVYEGWGEQPLAFEHFVKGNRLKREQIAYDQASTLNDLAAIKSFHTPELMEALRGAGEPSELPVFIVGMPRSGSTLVSQILASHHQIHSAGEITYFPDALLSLAKSKHTTGKIKPIHNMLKGPTRDSVRELGRRYLKSISELAPGARRVSDKLLENVSRVGLIHLALPKARIIDIRRDRLDNCLACFSELFTGGHSYSYDFEEIANYYRAYEQLMDHWRQLLPAGTILEVKYEDIVENLELQARRMIEFCGLDWDPACLRFYETKRWVRTASAEQVRRPIYQNSVGRARLYGDLLAPLKAALDLR